MIIQLNDTEALKNSRVAIIDADSIPHIISYNHRDRDDVDAVLANVDDFLTSIMKSVQARLYIGVLSYKAVNGIQEQNFRHAVAVTQPYKGNRGEKPEWYQKWAPYMEAHMIEKWGFVRVPYDTEADDLVVALHQQLAKVEGCTPILCHNDKDTRQSEGQLYNFRTNLPEFITHEASHYNLFYQVLMGDKTDNIPGLPGCGKVGAEKILTIETADSDNYPVVTLYAYIQKLGIDKGIQSFYENYMLCKMRDDMSTEGYFLTRFDLDAANEENAASAMGDLSEFEEINLDGLFKIEED